MVSKASDDLPDPETPEITVSLPCGISQSMPFKLWVRAPRITIASFTEGLSVVLFGGLGCTLQYRGSPPQAAAPVARVVMGCSAGCRLHGADPWTAEIETGTYPIDRRAALTALGITSVSPFTQQRGERRRRRAFRVSLTTSRIQKQKLSLKFNLSASIAVAKAAR